MAGTFLATATMSCAPKADGTVFLKTRMCTFHARGRCTRGSTCKFAHESQELQPVPDLHKTRPCLAFLRAGRCREGNACQYAHSRDELRTSLSSRGVHWPSEQEQISIKGRVADDTILEDEMAWSRQTTGIGIGDDGFDRQVSASTYWSETFEDSDKQSLNVNEVGDMLEACKAPGNALRKTKMCKFFLIGKCSRGKTCNFAHEANDLQPHPDLYRTKPCLALLRTGRCREGDACKYAHSRDEIRMEADTPYTSGTVTPRIGMLEADSIDGFSTSAGTDFTTDFGRSTITDCSGRSDSESTKSTKSTTEHSDKVDIDDQIEEQPNPDEGCGDFREKVLKAAQVLKEAKSKSRRIAKAKALEEKEAKRRERREAQEDLWSVVGQHLRGVVKSFKGGWGFINSPNFDGDLFVSQKANSHLQPNELQPGEAVEFEVVSDVKSDRGAQAVNVKRVEESNATERVCSRLLDASMLQGLSLSVKNTFLVFEEDGGREKCGSSCRARSL